MRIIFSTGSLYSYGTDRSFGIAARCGFDGIEVMADARWDTRQTHVLEGLVQRHGIPVVAVHSPFFSVPGWPPEQAGLIARSVELATTVGASVVVHHLPWRRGFALPFLNHKPRLLPLPGWEREKGYRRWLVSEYPTLQQSTDISLCIENLPARRQFGRRWNVHQWNAHSVASLDAILRFPSLTMDTTHLGTWGLEPVEVYGRWKERVRHIHLSNFDGREHRRPEDGNLRLDLLLAELAADEYQGAVSLELQPDALEAGASDDRVVELLSGSLDQCRKWAALEATSVSRRNPSGVTAEPRSGVP